MEQTINELFSIPSAIQGTMMRIFSTLGIDALRFEWIFTISYLIFSIVIALIGWILTRMALRFFLIPLINKSKNIFSEALLESKTLKWCARIVPFLILYLMYPTIFNDDKLLFIVLKNIFAVALVILITSTLLALLSVINVSYNTHQFSKQRPIKGYMQVVKILICIGAFLVAIGIIFDASLIGIFGGLGALSAVGLLVFKDPILALTASAQLTLNNMVHIGDWIQISAHSVDGEVIDMNLQSIRVQNWDKTIVSVPIYDLIAHSFINWRGMQESGGRRIKRALTIDMESVKFCTPIMIQRLKKYSLLHTYIESREQEISAANDAQGVRSDVDALSSRAMTNIGTFRAYIVEYLRVHPCVNQNLICMARQLPPTAHGIPIELYCFSNNQDWIAYESIQSDIFDHLMAVVPIFELRIFQSPGGHNIKEIGTQHHRS